LTIVVAAAAAAEATDATVSMACKQQTGDSTVQRTLVFLSVTITITVVNG